MALWRVTNRISCLLLAFGLTNVACAVQNPEYTNVGSSISVLDPSYLYDETECCGASIVGSNEDTTTIIVLPTILLENGLNADFRTTTMTVGPTTLIQRYTYNDIIFHRSCSYSDTVVAVCTSSLAPIPGAGTESSLQATPTTKTIQPARFQVYQVVESTPFTTPTSSRATSAPESTARAGGETTSKSAAGQAQITAAPGWIFGVAPVVLALL